MVEELKLFQPSEYYSLFIDNDVRPDERKLNTFGSTSVVVGCLDTANGSALVNIRETAVLCGIKAELTNPSVENPRKGFVVPNVDLPPVCSSRFGSGPPSEETQVVSQLMVDLLDNSSFLNLEDLCITEGQLCWCLYVDITCLNFSGNVLDACVLALVSAMKSLVLPSVSTEENKVRVDNTNCKGLPVGKLLFSSTFAVFNAKVVADPSAEEEYCSSGTISIFMMEDGTMCNIFMQHGCNVGETCLKHCIQQSKRRCLHLASIVNALTCEKN